MPALETPVCDFGRMLVDFTLPATDGVTYNAHDVMGENGLLVAFICNHCPFVKSINKRLVDDAHVLQSMGVHVVAINANDAVQYPEDDFDTMRVVAQQERYPFPYLYDETQEVAKAYGAVCTPDFFGYNAKGLLQYRGRLDASGREPSTTLRRDLVEAMQQVARTGEGPREQIASIGCSIKWK